MRLIHNWKAVLRYAWSIRFLVLAAVLSDVEVALPLVAVSADEQERFNSRLQAWGFKGYYLAGRQSRAAIWAVQRTGVIA
ncbi:MAG: hypothetical protein K5863_20920 [Nitratireductor sp.]|uniref:DUF7940 domain-containing protein n=1 Tax=Nitratireductor sp. TaxID=1872084 RepID=UPI00260D348F|nr:hypothetical protein [Nitratireductor sp.]MCV0352548.1 hypothetical protein [Nitratireductor sp.]